MNVLHLLVSGGTGGIEILMKDYAQYSTHRNIFVFVWKSGEIAQMMEQSGVPIYVTDAGRDGGYTTLKKLRRICEAEKVDVVVSHNSAPLLKLALIYMKMTIPRVRTVAYAHANARDICESGRKKGLLLRRLVHYMGFSYADGIVAISDSVKESLKEYLHVREGKIKRIYNGTHLYPAVIQESDPGERNCLKLIYVGRLIQEKGVQNTMQVLAMLQNKIPVLFTIVGDGPFRGELEAAAVALGLEDQIRFLGRRADIPALLAEADVFVHLPAWEEGFGITVIEALAAGRSCVVNDRGALPEIVKNGSNGFVVSADVPDEAAAALERLWQMSGEEWLQMQNCARDSAKQFSVESFTKELDDYLLRACL